jgi:hypothetical protein
MLSKKEILQLAPTQEIVDIGDGKVQMRGLSAREYGDYERSLFTQSPDGTLKPKPVDGTFRSKLVSRCLATEDGETFTEDEVASLDAGVVSRLYDVARRLCGVSDQDAEKFASGFGQAQQDGNSSE